MKLSAAVFIALKEINSPSVTLTEFLPFFLLRVETNEIFNCVSNMCYTSTVIKRVIFAGYVMLSYVTLCCVDIFVFPA